MSNEMSIEQLKKEYYNCDKDDIIKKNAIKKLIKYKNKEDKINAKMDNLIKLTQKKSNRYEKNISEIGVDFSNNKLMERLNSELDFRINDTKSKDIIKPYSNIEESYDSNINNDYQSPSNFLNPRKGNMKNNRF